MDLRVWRCYETAQSPLWISSASLSVLMALSDGKLCSVQLCSYGKEGNHTLV